MLQQTFKWPARPSYAALDFIISEANADAVRFLDAWPVGSVAALISGPEACGKTHLASRWAERVRAHFIDKGVLGKTDSKKILQGANHAVLEDIDSNVDATALFHLLRHAETEQLFLLLTARVPAKQLSFTLPDLRSRLLALPAPVIHAPDEALLKAYLFKCFSDRQLRVGEEVVTYILKRMERSFSAAHALVETLETHASQRRREITVPLVKSLLQ